MSRRRRGVQRPGIRAIGILAPALMLAVAGCANPGGVRSAWLDRPSLLRWRDRTPNAAEERPSRSRLAGRGRSGSATSRPGRDADRPASDGPPTPDDQPNAGRGLTPVDPGALASREPDRDDALQVTLGMPEPLPPLPEPDASEPAWTPVSPEGEAVADRAPVEPDRPRPPSSRPTRTASSIAKPTSSPRPSARVKRSSPPAVDKGPAILAQSEARLKSLTTYQVKMSRIERVDGKLQPEEEFLLSVRRTPREVRLEWASGPNKGREVIYSTRIDPRTLFVHMPSAGIPLPTVKMAIDNPIVVRSSRHSITEAGLDTIIENLRKSVDQVDADNTARGRANYRGIEKPPGLDRPSHVFTRRSPNRESWTVFIDAKSLFPSMVVAKNPAGELDEKYVYHEVIPDPPALDSADAFDPDKRWGVAKGLFSRFGKAGKAAATPSDSQSARE